MVLACNPTDTANDTSDINPDGDADTDTDSDSDSDTDTDVGDPCDPTFTPTRPRSSATT
jgi:hypothetical protein